MNFEAVRITFQDGCALICLVGKQHVRDVWEHIRTLSMRSDQDENVSDVARRYASELGVQLIDY